ncbi:MAG: tetratricopeptide repeat protein [Cyanobacteria bacterium HKST-UBA02]|nr:tetratricopeptide repeat protein [Cyanobacteria bacterium HKST-UBA02]
MVLRLYGEPAPTFCGNLGSIPKEVALLLYPDQSDVYGNDSDWNKWRFFNLIVDRHNGSEVLSGHIYRSQCRILETKLGAADHRTLTAMFVLVEYYRKRGLLVDAEAVARKAVRATRAVPGEKWVIGTSNWLGDIYSEQGRHTDAERLYRYSLNAAVRLGEEDSSGYIRLANCLASQGKLNAAEPFYLRGNQLKRSRQQR